VLYAPLESRDGYGTPPRVVFYDADLNVLGWEEIEPGGTNEIPWVAVNPTNGRLYTSTFNLGDPYYDPYQLRAYRIDKTGTSITLTRESANDIMLYNETGTYLADMPHVQGVAFSPIGHIYVVSDPIEKWGPGGVHIFDGVTHRRIQFMPISYDQRGCCGEYQELEGIDVWDLAGGGAPGIGGQFHVMMNAEPTHNIWFKHFQVADASNLAARYWR
jgi:hypothetical protein